jgi:hypothetical protein
MRPMIDMIGSRLQRNRALAALLFLSMLAGIEPVFAQSAEYRPPGLGTVLDYGTWQCEVTKVDGFDTECRTRSGATVVLHALLERTGPATQEVGLDFFDGFSCSTGSAITAIEMREKDRRALEAIWPLEVGKKAA